MDSTLEQTLEDILQTIQDILDEKIKVSPDIQQILQHEETKNELREQLPTLNLNALPRPTEIAQTTASLIEQAEVVVRLRARPVLFIQNNAFNVNDPTVSQLLLKPMKTKLKDVKNFQSAIRSTGKIGLPNKAPIDYHGTGWVVAPNIIVTNRHVAMEFATGENDSELSFKPEFKDLQIDFKAEHENDDEAVFKIKKILYIENFRAGKKTSKTVYPDIAFLEISDIADSAIPLPAPISLSEEPVTKDSDVAVIGYPGPSSNNDNEYLRRAQDESTFKEIFKGIYGVKRLQPGQLKLDKSYEDSRIFHDCTTLGGNSGSVVIDLDTGKAVGLHFGGIYNSQDINLNMNYAVPASTIRELLDKALNKVL